MNKRHKREMLGYETKMGTETGQINKSLEGTLWWFRGQQELKLYGSWFQFCFRMLPGQFETLLQILRPQLRRQSSNWSNEPDRSVSSFRSFSWFVSHVSNSGAENAENDLVNHCCCGRWDVCSAQPSWLDDTACLRWGKFGKDDLDPNNKRVIFSIISISQNHYWELFAPNPLHLACRGLKTALCVSHLSNSILCPESVRHHAIQFEVKFFLITQNAPCNHFKSL